MTLYSGGSEVIHRPRRLNRLTAHTAKRSNVRLFPTKADHETHVPAIGGAPQAYPRLSQQDEDRRRSQGAARTACQGPRPARGVSVRSTAQPAIGTNRNQRLSGTEAFARLFREGRRFSGRHLQLIAAPAARNMGAVGYIIARQHLPRAVDRNYLRRILRETLRSRRPAVLRFDIIVRLRARSSRAALRELATETAGLIDALVASKSP